MAGFMPVSSASSSSEHLRVIPAAHFSWEAEDDETASRSSRGSRASKRTSASKKTLSSQGTMGFGTGNPTSEAAKGNTSLKIKVRRRDARCAKCSYITGRIMSEHGRYIQIPMLVLIGVALNLVLGVAYSFVWKDEAELWDDRKHGTVNRYSESLWIAWTFMSDGGTHAKTYHAQQRFAGGFIAVCGIIYLAAVLAFIVDMVRERMNSMRVGKGQVYETDHTVILHWTDRTIPLILELCIANESSHGGVVVILAAEPMETMLMELNMQLPKSLRRGTQVVCRYGSPAIVSNLMKVSVDTARAVVILADGKGADEADSATLRCILSINGLGYKLSGHIVAEVRDVDNEPLLQLVGGKSMETFVSHDVLGRLMLMSVRQIGLASVYDAMLGFDGMEFYMKAWPELNGLAFGNLLEVFPAAVPIGIRTADGHVHLNPSPDMCVCEGDSLVVVAEDEFSYKPAVAARVETGRLPPLSQIERHPEKVLICGWRRDIRDILRLLDHIVAPGSEVHTMTHSISVEQRNELLLDEGLNVTDLQHIKLVHQFGNTSSRRRLDCLPLHEYTSCLIFADQSYEMDTMQADSHTLATLVLIRDVQVQNESEVSCPITCEVLDSRTQTTISGHKQLSMMSDFVQSNMFVARILAMIAEQRSVKLILNELLTAAGASLLIVPSSWYVADKEKVSFWAVAKRALARNAVLIGHQVRQEGSLRKTTLNPADKDRPIAWDTLDLAIISSNAAFDGLEQNHSDSPGSPTHQLSPRSNGSLSPTKQEHLAIDMTSPESADAVPDESGICSSADTATSVMAKLTAKHCLRMSEEDKIRFGTTLSILGKSVQKGSFPATVAKMYSTLFDEAR